MTRDYKPPKPTSTIKIHRSARNAVEIKHSDKEICSKNREVRINFQEDFVQVQIIVEGKCTSVKNIKP